MPVPLIYELEVHDAQLKRVLRGVEKEAQASASRVDREFGRVGTSGRGRVGQDPRSRQVGRGFDQIGRAARAADAHVIRERMRGERRAEAERLRGIERIAKAEERAAAKANAAKVRTAERAGRGAARTLGGGISKVVGVGANALALGGGLVGGIAAGNALSSRIDAHAAAAALANQAFGNPGETRSRAQIQADVLKQSGDIDRRTGIGEANVVGGLRRYTAISGDLGGAQKIIPFLAQLADAVDADLGDLGEAAGKVHQALNIGGISDANGALEQTQQVIATMAQQSKIGSLEMKDFAQHIGEITASAGRFGGAAPAGMIKFMSALGQLAVAGGGDAAEAATAVARLPSDITNHLAKLRGMGLTEKELYTDKSHTQLQAAPTIMSAILRHTGGNLEKVQDIFGERAVKAFYPLQKIFTTAERNKKGTGQAAVDEALRPFLEATLTPGDINQSAAFRQGQEDRQISRAMGEFNRKVGEELVPVLTQLVPKFSDMIPQLTDVASTLASFASSVINNPIPNIGLLIAGKVTADLAAAGLSSVVASGLAKLMAALALQGGIVGLATKGVTAAGSALAGTLGGGAAAAGGLTLGLAGGAALGAVGAVGYNLYKLNEESGQEGIWESLKGAWKGPARAGTPEEYDAMMRKSGINREPQTGPGGSASLDASAANKQLEQGANRAADILVQKIASANVTPDRRTNPVIRR